MLKSKKISLDFAVAFKAVLRCIFHTLGSLSFHESFIILWVLKHLTVCTKNGCYVLICNCCTATCDLIRLSAFSLVQLVAGTRVLVFAFICLIHISRNRYGLMLNTLFAYSKPNSLYYCVYFVLHVTSASIRFISIIIIISLCYLGQKYNFYISSETAYIWKVPLQFYSVFNICIKQQNRLFSQRLVLL